MEWIVSRIAPLAGEEPHLSWQRNSIYLRFGHRDFHKGSSLSEVARLHDLTATNCFAIGDSHNDLNMLDAAHAGMIACPANSVPEIHAKVSASGGLIAQGIHAHGAIEALKHYFPG
jgi:hydroxymethylpyrimidine pyrophosphatase-like HAD family hydrolase